MDHIELTDVSAYYKLKKEYVVALDKLSLSVKEGEFLTIAGPSGCGKSTLLKCILGQVELTEGIVRIRGEELTGDRIKRANIAYISQDYQLYPHLNVYENIAFPLRMAEMDPEKVDARVRSIAERCNLMPALLNRKPRQLSAGQQQRVALAKAFVKQPSLVLADEPFSHLDPKMRTEFQEWIYDYYREMHTTILFVTHDEDEARALGGRLLRMDHGMIAALEDTSSYGTPQDRRTTDSIPNILLKKEIAQSSRRTRLMYRWPIYLLGLVAFLFVASTIWSRWTEPNMNEKLSVCFVGQNFHDVEAQEQLAADTSVFTDQKLEKLNLESLYNENGTLLAEALTVRCLGDTDIIILEDDFVFDEIGSRYFCEIPEDVIQAYFPGAAVYEEAGSIYGICLHPLQNSAETSAFSSYYDGKRYCWLFFTVTSENVAAFNGKGSPDDTAALDLAAYLWRTE